MMTVDEFWDWSLARYSDEATRDHLLALQANLDLVVLEALFASWLGSRYFVWEASAVRRLGEASQDWLEGVVMPLRATRTRWRSQPALQTARQHLLSLEVQAERHLAELIWQGVMVPQGCATDVRSHPGAAADELMNANLSVLPVFQDGKYVSERTQVVVLLGQAT